MQRAGVLAYPLAELKGAKMVAEKANLLESTKEKQMECKWAAKKDSLKVERLEHQMDYLMVGKLGDESEQQLVAC